MRAALLSFRNRYLHFWFIPKQIRQGIRRTVVFRLILPRLEQAKMVRAPRLAASAARRGARSFRTPKCALVGRPFGHPDDVNAAVIGSASLPSAGSGGDSRCVNALFAEIFHTVGGAVAGDFLGLALLGVGEADDDGAAPRFILQAERNVIEDAFADVVDARAERFAERAIADLFSLRRHRDGLHLDRR